MEIEPGFHALAPANRALCQELVYGVTRWQRTLDWLIDRKTAGRTQKAQLRALLEMGLYQMFWLDRIPNHAAVNETVELARQFGFGPQAGFVNAVLRSYGREEVETRTLLKELKSKEPALGYSHPDWLYQRWLERWGGEKAVRLLEWNNRPPPNYARVNGLKTDAARLRARWDAEGVKFTAGRWDWIEEEAMFRLESHPSLASLVSFREGLFYVQDPSTLLAVNELDPQPGDSVLDLCAAPGGKTTLIGQRMLNKGTIVATDIQEDRLELVRENCARLGGTNVTVSKSEFHNPKSEPGTARSALAGSQFDRILVDAPCSNTGVMRRRVDLRWRVTPEEIQRLRATQLELLQQAAPQLKPGGTLVYSTCSLEPEENDSVISEFLSTSPDLKLARRRELLPFADDVDGAFVATMIRT
jgi:16S rRNA (cytosine967-C5)-methyltransferase